MPITTTGSPHRRGDFRLLFMQVHAPQFRMLFYPHQYLYPPQLLLSMSVPNTLFTSGISPTIHSRIVS